jgi:hypothetical protein
LFSVLLAAPIVVNNVSADSTIVGAERQQLPQYLDPVLLQLGDDIYANLRRARSAVLNRERTLLIVAVDEMRDDLVRLHLPPQELALANQQLVLNSQTTTDTGKPFDRQQWLPLQIQVDETEELQPVPPSDRTLAPEGPMSDLNDSFGVFPLQTLSDHLLVAWTAAHRRPADWQTALTAVRSALASIRWYSRSPDPGAASAYEDANRP